MASSGLTSIAFLISATASSALPCSLRALPSLLWAEASVEFDPDRLFRCHKGIDRLEVPETIHPNHPVATANETASVV